MMFRRVPRDRTLSAGWRRVAAGPECGVAAGHASPAVFRCCRFTAPTSRGATRASRLRPATGAVGARRRRAARLKDIEEATNYVRAALDAGLAGKPIAVAQTQPYGCDVKY